MGSVELRGIVRCALGIAKHLCWFWLLYACLTTAHAQSLSGIHIGDPFTATERVIGFPPWNSERSGPYTIAKWRLGDGNSLSVTAKSGTGEIVYIETDWGRRTSYTDFRGLHYGKTTLAEIKGKLGNDNFAWDGEHMPDTSLVMKNSYRVNYKDVIITLVTELAKETVPDIPKKIRDPSQIDRVFTLVAIILGDPDYLASIWGAEHLPKPNARRVALSVLQPSDRVRNRPPEEDGVGIEIQLTEGNGTFLVPVQINGRLVLDFTIDSGAADVQIPGDVLLTLTRTGTVSKGDFLGTQTYMLADGSSVPSPRFMLHTLEIGGHAIHDVAASVGSVDSPPLLGQSFLSKLGSWTIDNTRHILTIVRSATAGSEP